MPQSYQKTSNYVQIDNNILEKQLREQLIEHQRNKYRSRTSSPDKTSQSSPNMNKLTQNTTEKLLIDDIQIRLNKNENILSIYSPKSLPNRVLHDHILSIARIGYINEETESIVQHCIEYSNECEEQQKLFENTNNIKKKLSNTDNKHRNMKTYAEKGRGQKSRQKHNKMRALNQQINNN